MILMGKKGLLYLLHNTELNAWPWPTVKILYIFEGVQNFCHFSFRQHENEKA